MKKKQLEMGMKLMLDFGKIKQIANCGSDVIPVVVQDWLSKEVLFLAYTNREAFELALQSGVATFWSTTRKQIWIKGKTSGCTLKIKDIRVNCEQNSLLYIVQQEKDIGVCHVRDRVDKYQKSCYYRLIANWQTKKIAFVRQKEENDAEER